MINSIIRKTFFGIAMGLLTASASLFAAATVTITINESSTQPLPPGFAGYNAIFATGASSMLDTNLQSKTQPLAVGWLRYPGGTLADAFDLNSGYLNLNWANQVGTGFLITSYYQLLGRAGGAQFGDMNTFSNAVNSKGLIVCINGFTDTPASIGTFAANAAKADSIPIYAYELSNEPYQFPTFFPTSTAYLEAMEPYAAAIRAADPKAKLSVAILGDSSWDSGIGSFQNPYWDYVSLHDYPVIRNPGGNPTVTLIPSLNQVLATRVNYISQKINPYIGATTPILITEYGPSGPDNGFYGTLYGGIYVAEYALRMVTQGQVIKVGPHALLGDNAGLGSVNNYDGAVYSMGQKIAANVPGAVPLDTTSSPFDFGYFVSAQAAAYSLVSKGMATATKSASTSVTGGGTVPILNNQAMPAVYAQAFTSGTHTWLVITNKGSTAQTVSIVDSKRKPSASLSVTTVTAQDPLTANTSETTAKDSSGKAVAVVKPVTKTITGNVPLPAYSVVLVDW